MERLARLSGAARQLGRWLRRPPLRFFARPFEPFNWSAVDASPAAVERDARYALQVAQDYLAKLAVPVRGRALLELGPGISLGTAAVMACQGARVALADPFPPRWQAGYHPRVYGEMLRLRPDLLPDRAPLERLIAGDFAGVFQAHAVGAESLQALPAAAFDLIVSNAVFEHVGDVPAAALELRRISRPGAVGVHGIDLRDHRDFTRPLELLTLDSVSFARLFRDVAGECGNRLRVSEHVEAFRRAGFGVEVLWEDRQVDEAYFQDVAARLHPNFWGFEPDELRVLGVSLRLSS